MSIESIGYLAASFGLALIALDGFRRHVMGVAIGATIGMSGMMILYFAHAT